MKDRKDSVLGLVAVVGAIHVGCAVVVVLSGLVCWPFMASWNYAIAPTFSGVNEINLLQSFVLLLGIVLLVGLLMGRSR